jgi:hypothetical protein
MHAYSVHGGNEDLWTLFDMIIGRNARVLFPNQIIPILKCFAGSQFKREKLFILLQHIIKGFDYSVAENCEIIRIYGELEFGHDDIYRLMDKRLASNILNMSETDLTNVMIGFSNLSIAKKYKVNQNIEQHIDKIAPQLSLKNANLLLHRFGTQRKGSKKVIDTLLDRVYEVSDSTEEIAANDVFMTIHVFDLLGCDNKYFYPLLSRVVEQVQGLDFERLRDLFEILYKRFSDERFNKAIITLKRQIEKYESNGEEKNKQ